MVVVVVVVVVVFCCCVGGGGRLLPHNSRVFLTEFHLPVYIYRTI